MKASVSPEKSEPEGSEGGVQGASRRAAAKAYWRANMRIVGILMFFWAFLSLGCGILWSEWLDQWTVPGTHFKWGFFMAQQGAIYGFLVLIVVYIWQMNRLDKKFRAHSGRGDGEDEQELENRQGGPAGGH